MEEEKKTLEKKKTYAEVKCDKMPCNKCPFRKLVCGFSSKKTLQEKLDRMDLDDEEREFYQKRINKEYKEEEWNTKERK